MCHRNQGGRHEQRDQETRFRQVRHGVLGTAALAGGLSGQRPLDAQTPRKASPDLAVVTGTDPFLAVNKGLEALGGMKRFVKPGATVGLLINAPAWWKRPGSHTHPDLTLAVIVAALEAGRQGDPLPHRSPRRLLEAVDPRGQVREGDRRGQEMLAQLRRERSRQEQDPQEGERRQGVPRLRRLRQPAHHQAPRRRRHVGQPQEPHGRQHQRLEPVLPLRLGGQGRIRRHPLPGPVRRRPQHPAQAGPVRRRRHGIPADQRAVRARRAAQVRQGHPRDRSRGRRRLRRASAST